MSDWEEESDEEGVVVPNTFVKSAQLGGEPPYHDNKAERVFVGLGSGSGDPRKDRTDRNSKAIQYKSRRGRGEARPSTWSTGSRTPGSETSPPVTFTLENSLIGRVIGRYRN